MLERGLLPDFSAPALAEAAGLPADLGPRPPGVRDLRDRLWASIDNDDSRDLDQLSVAETAGGATRVLVAIADVDARVGRATALDTHAKTNTTSVYTDAGIFPMLPERLSTDLTSLNEGQERLAIVVDMQVDDDGVVQEGQVYRALVLNKAKLAYNAVAAWLEGTAPAPAKVSSVGGLAETLKLQDRVAQALRRQRHEHGALDLETREPRAVFDGEAVTDLRLERPNRAKQLIEDLMVAANLVTARFLKEKRSPSVRRVLRSPERWARLVELALGYGAHLPAEPDAPALSAFLADRRRADPERFPDVSLAVVKLLGRGEYAVQVPGQGETEHFGLAVHGYAHATAPNRRFPDLLTQRLIKAALAAEPPPYTAGDLDALARHCTEAEEAAAKVERTVRKAAAALLMQSRIGELFQGLVTGASPKGTWVRLSRPAVEGRIVHGFQGLDVGDRVIVKLEHTDVERGFIDFDLARRA
jgi:exoribonuclease-2